MLRIARARGKINFDFNQFGIYSVYGCAESFEEQGIPPGLQLVQLKSLKLSYDGWQKPLKLRVAAAIIAVTSGIVKATCGFLAPERKKEFVTIDFCLIEREKAGRYGLIPKRQRRKAQGGKEEKLARFASLRENLLLVFPGAYL